jgi:hypothetical protein
VLVLQQAGMRVEIAVSCLATHVKVPKLRNYGRPRMTTELSLRRQTGSICSAF